MKFCKTYQEYMQMQGGRERQIPVLGFKNLKKILKKCRTTHEQYLQNSKIEDSVPISNCPNQCPVCDGSFFPALLMEMCAVVGCFNERAQNLLDVHLATGFKKFFIWCKGKLNDHIVLIHEGQQLVTYAMINAIAVRKILKKYDKIHYSKQGQEFKSQVQRMHIEILQSPLLCELMALQINLREQQVKQREATAFDGCSLILADGKPSLTCELFSSIKLEIDLTCSICLEPVFDPVALTCGHIFCYICACSAASVTIVDGLKAADRKKACPLCREAGVYDGSVHLEELNILLGRRCGEYWKLRLQLERAQRIQQAKEHWEKQSRGFLGV